MQWPYLATESPFGMAHRGGDVVAPENTMAAFAHATEVGFRYLETDVHLTTDGVLVAFHDPDLSRLVGRPVRIDQMTWDEVSAVTIDNEHSIPQLRDLFEAFPGAYFNIDPKADETVEPLAAMITEFDLIDQVGIGSFSDDRIDHARQLLGPRLCTSPGPNGVAKTLAAALLWPWWRPAHGCLQIPIRAYGINLDRPWLIRRVQKLGLQVHFWTINDAGEMRRLLEAGADAIISDKTTTLLQVLADFRAGR